MPASDHGAKAKIINKLNSPIKDSFKILEVSKLISEQLDIISNVRKK